MDYITEFSADCAMRGFTNHTVESYRSNIKDFLTKIEDPTKITPICLRNHLSTLVARNYRGSTLKSYYAALNAFFDFLIFEGSCTTNPIPAFRKRYLTRLMKQRKGETRQIISVSDMRELIQQADDIRIKAVLVIFAKTGIRRGEFLDLKPDNINLDKDIINLPNKAKRSRQTIFIDEELHHILDEYLEWRTSHSNTKWLWITERGGRMLKDQPGHIIASLAQPLGLHKPDGPLDERLTPHCFRHFLTTELFRKGMDPQYIKWLRGDSLQAEAWQIYNHIDPDMVRAEYERCIPKLL